MGTSGAVSLIVIDQHTKLFLSYKEVRQPTLSETDPPSECDHVLRLIVRMEQKSNSIYSNVNTTSAMAVLTMFGEPERSLFPMGSWFISSRSRSSAFATTLSQRLSFDTVHDSLLERLLLSLG